MPILKKNLQIAIDGPVAAGKGTVSRLLAEKLNILYVDTGAMYRALTLFVKNHQFAWEDEVSISKALNQFKPVVSLSLSDNINNPVQVFLDGGNITGLIRTEKISHGVSIVSSYKDVRTYIVPQQQKLASQISVVMEGRDITTVVLPNADLKIYLDADEDTRVKRRFDQLKSRGELNLSLENIKKELHERDYRDSHRDIDPLIITKDAWHLDTSGYSIEEVIDLICDRLKEMSLIS